MTTTTAQTTQQSACVVHAPSVPDWDDRGPWDFEPSVEELTADLVVHLSGSGCGPCCGDCFDEYQVRRVGIEDVNLEDDHTVRQILDACSCGRGLG